MLWERTPVFYMPSERDLVWACAQYVLELVSRPFPSLRRIPPKFDEKEGAFSLVLTESARVSRSHKPDAIRNAIVDMVLSATLGGSENLPASFVQLMDRIGYALAHLTFKAALLAQDTGIDAVEGVPGVVLRLSRSDRAFQPVSFLGQESQEYMRDWQFRPALAQYMEGGELVAFDAACTEWRRIARFSVGCIEDLENGPGCIVENGWSVVPASDECANWLVRHYGRTITRRLSLRKGGEWTRAFGAYRDEIDRRTWIQRELRLEGRQWVLDDEDELIAAAQEARNWLNGVVASWGSQTKAVEMLGAPTSEPFVFDQASSPPCIARLWREAAAGRCHWNDSGRLAVGLYLRETVPVNRRADAHAAVVEMYEAAIATYDEASRVAERRHFVDEMARLILRDKEQTRAVSCRYMQEHNNGASYGTLCAMSAALGGAVSDIEDLVGRHVPRSDDDLGKRRWVSDVTGAVSVIKSQSRPNSKARQFLPQTCCAALMHRIAHGVTPRVFIMSGEQYHFRLYHPTHFRPFEPAGSTEIV